MKTVRDFDVKNKRVLVRCDFNVPLGLEGNILDDFRIKAAIPTIEHLIRNGAKIILMSHLGDPEGKVVEKLRLDIIQERLIALLNRGIKDKPAAVLKADDCMGKEIEKISEMIEPGEILLLENLRFHKEEEENDKIFAKELSKLGDIYINDAFGACHRKHASVVGITKYLKSGMGLLLEKEINTLDDFMKKSEKPLVVVIGGKKIEKKALERISGKADYILIGGPIKGELENQNVRFRHPERIIEQFEDPEEKDVGEKSRVARDPICSLVPPDIVITELTGPKLLLIRFEGPTRRIFWHHALSIFGNRPYLAFRLDVLFLSFRS